MSCKNTINGELLNKMLVNGFINLSHNIDYLNEINVFPVSDGDTGTNMKKTFGNGVTALINEHSFSDTFSAFVKCMLVGSRGNSGFILSQYFLGIHECTKGKEAVSVDDLSFALLHAYEKAYNALLKPVEGSMLTIMREGINRTLAKINDETSIIEFFDILVSEMFLCMKDTINQMDLLRNNNVLDSGAVGLYLIFDGMKRALHDDLQHFDCKDSDFPIRSKNFVKNISFFRYCTEFTLIMNEARNKDYFVELLSNRGDSIAISAEENVLKVHIHTNEPEDIMNEFSKFGDFAVKKIDDLFKTQEFEKLKLRKHTGFAIIVFTNGDGAAAALEQLGADIAFSVPLGHNPAEQGLKKLIDGFLNENIIIFPDNKETYNKFIEIRKASNLQNLYIADSDSLSKTIFMLSSLIFSDEFKNVIELLETLKDQRVFQTSISAAIADDHVQYSGNLMDKIITRNDFLEILKAVADEKLLEPYSTVVVFGGKNCKPKDVNSIQAYFENNSNVGFAYFEGLQHDCDFIIGAY